MLKKTRTLIAAFAVALFLAGAVPTQAMQRNLTRLTIIIAVLFALNSILLGFQDL